MTQAPTRSREPLLIYIEANPLVYWMLQESHDDAIDGVRHHQRCHEEAQNLVSVAMQHRAPEEQIIVVTSQWALIEAHSILYKDALL